MTRFCRQTRQSARLELVALALLAALLMGCEDPQPQTPPQAGNVVKFDEGDPAAGKLAAACGESATADIVFNGEFYTTFVICQIQDHKLTPGKLVRLEEGDPEPGQLAKVCPQGVWSLSINGEYHTTSVVCVQTGRSEGQPGKLARLEEGDPEPGQLAAACEPETVGSVIYNHEYATTSVACHRLPR